MRSTLGARAACVAVLAGFMMAGCSGGQSDLQKWIAETKKKPGGRIQALPEVKPYETFVYRRIPCVRRFSPRSRRHRRRRRRPPPSARVTASSSRILVDTPKMVGTFGGRQHGLVQLKDASCTRCSLAILDRTMKVTDISAGRLAPSKPYRRSRRVYRATGLIGIEH